MFNQGNFMNKMRTSNGLEGAEIKLNSYNLASERDNNLKTGRVATSNNEAGGN